MHADALLTYRLWPWVADWTVPLGHALQDFLWQGAAVAAGAWLMLFALRNARPQWRYAVACLALSICLALPLLSVWRFGMAADGIAAIGNQATAPWLSSASGGPAPLAAADAAWWSALTGAHLGAKIEAFFAAFERTLPGWVLAWALGVMLMLGRTLTGLVWVHRLRTTAVAPLDPALIAGCEALRLRIGVARAVRLCASADAAIARLGPVAIGVVAPVVMLPAALVARMPSDLLQALIAHELAHIRRHDYLVNLVQTLAEALLFYHPAVWWLSRRIRHERELVADDLAARALGDPRTLAKALAELDRLHAETAATPLLSHLPHMLSQAARGGPLMSRIRSLTQPARPAPGIALPLVAVGAIAAACLAYAQTDRPNPSPAPKAAIAGKTEPLPKPMPQPLPAPSAAALALGSQADTGVTGMTLGQSFDRALAPDDQRDRSFALVRAGEEGFAISGALDDVERIRAAKARIDGDFLWFRRDGKAYVVRDPATIARIGAAWSVSEANEAKMQALSAQIERKSADAQALAQQLSAKAAERAFEQAKAHERMAYQAEIAASQQLAAQLADTARQQAALEMQHAQQGQHSKREAAALEAQQAALERRMQSLEAEIEAKSAKLEADVESEISAMERDLEARLEAANGPLEAIGAEMEALAKEQDKIMAKIEREVGDEIERALRENLVEPAP